MKCAACTLNEYFHLRMMTELAIISVLVDALGGWRKVRVGREGHATRDEFTYYIATSKQAVPSKARVLVVLTLLDCRGLTQIE